MRAKALEENSSLQKLVVTTYRWRFEQAILAVAKMLLLNSTLQDLTISAVDRASLPIIQALESNRTLTRLELCRGSSGHLPMEIHQGVVEVLRKNAVLQDLLVSRHPWPNADIASYLTFNRVQKQVIENTPQTQQEWLEAIVDHRYDTRVLHLLLSKNPSLCCVGT